MWTISLRGLVTFRFQNERNAVTLLLSRSSSNKSNITLTHTYVNNYNTEWSRRMSRHRNHKQCFLGRRTDMSRKSLYIATVVVCIAAIRAIRVVSIFLL